MENQKFDCTGQRINDVMEAIRKIKPVVSLIKKREVKENERMSLFETVSSDNNDLDKLNRAMSSISNEDIKEEVKLIFDKYSNRVLAIKDKIEKLETELGEIAHQIQEYLDYANSFYYLSQEEIVQDLLGKAISEECSQEEFFVILLILRSDCVEDQQEVEEKAREYATDTKNEFRKHILKHLEDYDQDDICALIREQ